MKNLKSQQGVTLVISVVLLASVTFISFSISTVIIRELGTAQLILRTEPAISGANSGGEIGLYRLLRELGGTTTGGTTPQSGATYQVSPKLYVDPYKFSINDGKEIRIGLYDAEKTTNKLNLFQSVNVINQGNDPFKVTIYSWGDFKNAYCPQRTATKNDPYACVLNHPTDDRYIVVIVPNTNNATGEISAVRQDGSKGVPADSPEIQITGRSGNVQRKLEISF